MSAWLIVLIVLAGIFIPILSFSFFFPKLSVKLHLSYPPTPTDDITGLSDDIIIIRYGALSPPQLHCSECGHLMTSHITEVNRYPDKYDAVTGQEHIRIVARYECPNDKGMTWTSNGHSFYAATWPNDDEHPENKQWYGTYELLPRSPWFVLPKGNSLKMFFL